MAKWQNMANMAKYGKYGKMAKSVMSVRVRFVHFCRPKPHFYTASQNPAWECNAYFKKDLQMNPQGGSYL